MASVALSPRRISVKAITSPDRFTPAWQRMSTRAPDCQRAYACADSATAHSIALGVKFESGNPNRNSSTSHGTG